MTAASGLRPTVWYGLVGLALVAVFALSVVVTVNGGLRWDDFGNLRFTQEAGTLDFLLNPVYDHFAPGHRALTLLQYALGPSNTAGMHLVMSGIQTIALAGFIATAARLYGRRAWIPILAVIVSASTTLVSTQLWFAAALHQTPALAAGLWAVYFFLRYRQDGTGRSLLVSVLLIVLGLTFVSKVLLAVGVIYLLDQLLLRPTARLRDVVGRTLDEWPLWLAYVLPATLYLVLATELVSPTQVPSRTGSVLAGIRAAWLERFVPALVGWDPELLADDAGPRLAVVILVQVLAAVAVLVAARRRRDSLRALAIVLLVVAANGVMTLVLRVDAFGTQVATTPRYWLEPVVFAALLLPWGFVRPPDADAPAWVRHPPRLARGAVAGTVFLVGVAGSSVLSLSSFVDDNSAYRARVWLEDLQAAVASADGSPSLVDDLTPIAWTPFWTLRDLQFLIPEARFRDDPAGSLVVDDRLVEPEFVPFFELAGADLPDNSLVAIDGDVRVDGRSLCALGETVIGVVVQPSEARRFGLATFRGEGAARFEPQTEPWAGQPSRQLYGGSGSRATVLFPMDRFPWTGFELRLEPGEGSPLCLEALSVGVIDNAPPLPE